MHQEKKTQNNGAEPTEIGFIVVHLGAGYHSKAKLPRYKALCNRACKLGMQLCKSGYLASEIACKVVSMLEDSELTNAGIGSNLTKDMTVQCDAGVMDSLSGNFAAVGCLEGIKNPIRAVCELLRSQENYIQGLVPPLILVGDGARKFAIEKGVECISSSEMITENAVDSYHKAVGVLRKECSVKDVFKNAEPKDKLPMLMKETKPNSDDGGGYSCSDQQEMDKDDEVCVHNNTEISNDLPLFPNEESCNRSETAAIDKGTQYVSIERRAPRHKRKCPPTDKNFCFKRQKSTSSGTDYGTNNDSPNSHSGIGSSNACSFEKNDIYDLSREQIAQNLEGCYDKQSGNLLPLNASLTQTLQELSNERSSREKSLNDNSGLNQPQTLRVLLNDGSRREKSSIYPSLNQQRTLQDLSTEGFSREKSLNDNAGLNQLQTLRDSLNDGSSRRKSSNYPSLKEQKASQDFSNEGSSKEKILNDNADLNQQQTLRDLLNDGSSRRKCSNYPSLNQPQTSQDLSNEGSSREKSSIYPSLNQQKTSQDLSNERFSRGKSLNSNAGLNQLQTLRVLLNDGSSRKKSSNYPSLNQQKTLQDLLNEGSRREKSFNNNARRNQPQTLRDLLNDGSSRRKTSNYASLNQQKTSQDLSNEGSSREKSLNDNAGLNLQQTWQDLSIERSCKEKIPDDRELIMDTVGAICVDKFGNICSAVSSGGLLLKQPGRIGQAACYGGGCFVAEENRDSDIILTASSVSGCGEQLIKTNLAKHCAETLLSDDFDVMLNPSYLLEKGFLDSRYLRCEEEKLAGCINIRMTQSNGHLKGNALNSLQDNRLADEKSVQDGRGAIIGSCSLDLIIACTTRSFCFGFMSSTEKKPKAVLLEMPEKKKPGNSVVSQVFHFELQSGSRKPLYLK